jgi:GNAT superfamily N-acetyltransferase
MEPDDIQLRQADPSGDESRRCLAQYYAELDRRFESGFDPGDAAYAGSPGAAVHCILAFRGGRPIACGQLVWKNQEIGEIKRMWVAPEARGLGLARRLLEALEHAARANGLRALRLDTNKALPEPQRLYRSAGYAEIARYSDNPYAHHWFGKTL